ncbi:hypothetical protein ABTF26_20945, partial [Acinetobacter baumannii]
PDKAERAMPSLGELSAGLDAMLEYGAPLDTFISLLLGLLRHLAFNIVFYLIGCGLLKLITLGRYPRWRPLRAGHWRVQAQDVD